MSNENEEKKPCDCCCSEPSTNESNSKGPQRRGVLGMLIAGGFGLAALAAPIGAGIATVLNPMRSKCQAGELCRIAPLTSLPEDGTPQKFPVVLSVRKDAWNIFHSRVAGTVFLRLVGKDKVEALSDICPHAGCKIEFDKGGERFCCPCHTAYFALDGKRTQENSPSPRDMDTLDWEIKDGAVWVKFEKFKGGTSTKIAEA